MDDGALVGDVEHGVDPTDTHAEAHETAEFYDLGGTELRIHTLKEFISHLGMRKTEALGELNG